MARSRIRCLICRARLGRIKPGGIGPLRAMDGVRTITEGGVTIMICPKCGTHRRFRERVATEPGAPAEG